MDFSYHIISAKQAVLSYIALDEGRGSDHSLPLAAHILCSAPSRQDSGHYLTTRLDYITRNFLDHVP